jgi:nickel-dependent lactate racemase
VKHVEVPWGAWYEDSTMALSFPDDWIVEEAKMVDAPDISDEDIRRAFENPIESPTITEMAKGRKSAVILVDDLSRPTQAYRIVP